MTKYAELRLRIDRGVGRGSYRIVATGPAGEALGRFKLPFSDLELENFILKVGATRRGRRRIDSPEMELAKNFGTRLFGALFEGDVRELYRSSFSEMRSAGQGLRVTLSLTGAPELLQVPWEYMYDHPSFLSISTWTPIVRYLDLPKPRRPLQVALPIRILAMVSSPNDAEVIDAPQERAKLEAALAPLIESGAIAIDWLGEASLRALQRQLRRGDYHVFHFIGHGGYDQDADDGVLLFQDEVGRGRRVSGIQLGTILADEVSLRLAVLNSCEGARSSLQDPFSGVATSLIEREIPAVIGMQFEITDRAAIVFAGEFYAALADGLPVDSSVAEARKAIYADQNDIEWGTPVLFMRVADGRLFDVQSHAPIRTPGAPAAAAVALRQANPNALEVEDADELEHADDLEDAEGLRAERVEAERVEAERVEAERVEAERVEAERVEAERAEAERAEAERAEQERRANEAADAVERERVAAEAAATERLHAERAEAERAEAERAEQERLAREVAQAAERDRVAAEAAEAERLEAERLESERMEAERLESERIAAQRVEEERLAAEAAADERERLRVTAQAAAAAKTAAAAQTAAAAHAAAPAAASRVAPVTVEEPLSANESITGPVVGAAALSLGRGDTTTQAEALAVGQPAIGREGGGVTSPRASDGTFSLRRAVARAALGSLVGMALIWAFVWIVFPSAFEGDNVEDNLVIFVKEAGLTVLTNTLFVAFAEGGWRNLRVPSGGAYRFVGRNRWAATATEGLVLGGSVGWLTTVALYSSFGPVDELLNLVSVLMHAAFTALGFVIAEAVLPGFRRQPNAEDVEPIAPPIERETSTDREAAGTRSIREERQPVELVEPTAQSAAPSPTDHSTVDHASVPVSRSTAPETSIGQPDLARAAGRAVVGGVLTTLVASVVTVASGRRTPEDMIGQFPGYALSITLTFVAVVTLLEGLSPRMRVPDGDLYRALGSRKWAAAAAEGAIVGATFGSAVLLWLGVSFDPLYLFFVMAAVVGSSFAIAEAILGRLFRRRPDQPNAA